MTKRSLAVTDFICLASLLATLVACRGLPNNFASLPLEQQVAAYEDHLQNYGTPLLEAESHISWHGWRAADLMEEYLNGKKHGISAYEALEIIHFVQIRGCSLKGTPTETIVRDFLAREPKYTNDHLMAQVTLEAIKNNRMTPGEIDSLKGGPCETGTHQPPTH